MSLRLTFIIHASYILFLETTDRITVRAIVVVRRIDVAKIAVEVQAARAVTIRRCRPIATDDANIVEAAIAVVAITRSRIPDGTCGTELDGEVQTLVGAAVQ